LVNGSAYTLISGCSISFNTANLNGSGIEYLFADHQMLNNCALTNNRCLGTGSIVFIATGFQDLTISGNTFGGTNGSSDYAILESFSDTAGHTLVYNRFLTNTMQYLYHDFSGNDIGGAGWTNINDTNYTLAAYAYTNTAQ
jgi:hypothetical protein